MPAQTSDATVDALIDGLGSWIASLGINRVAGQLYVLLFLSEEPLSLDAMTERLRVSKGHVSTNIRALERWHAVRRVVVRGTRKDYYEANRDALTVIFDQLQSGLRQRLQEMEYLLQRPGREGRACGAALSPEVSRRLGEINAMVKTASSLVQKLALVKPFISTPKGRHV